MTSIVLEACESENSELKNKTKHVITSLLLKEKSVTETLLQPLYTHPEDINSYIQSLRLRH